jgi:hypothetical protein
MQQAEADDEGLDAVDSEGRGDATEATPKFSVLLSALRDPTARNANLLSDAGPVVPTVVYTGPTRPPGWKPPRVIVRRHVAVAARRGRPEARLHGKLQAKYRPAAAASKLAARPKPTQ